jgi:hypothetical protein
MKSFVFDRDEVVPVRLRPQTTGEFLVALDEAADRLAVKENLPAATVRRILLSWELAR